jgi:formylglycine-generating enzyme required for sulfatase activity
MGSPDDEFGHPQGTPVEQIVEVVLTHAFIIARHELTQSEWTIHGLPDPGERLPAASRVCVEANCPVEGVTWFDAVAFANLLSERNSPPLRPCYDLQECTGKLGQDLVCGRVGTTTPSLYECEGFRLPTEAEWEYATRAGTQTAFYSGALVPPENVADRYTCYLEPNLERIAWYCNNSSGHIHPVEGKEANAWGLYDTLGNAREWVNETRLARLREYAGSRVMDPGAVLDATYDSRVQRGGGPGSPPALCRASSQTRSAWEASVQTYGLRLVRTLLPDDK